MAKSRLAVDDSASMRRMVSFTLQGNGYEVAEAGDREDALAKARAKTHDLVLTDQNKPRMDGLSLVRAMRPLASDRTAPILILTTQTGQAMKNKGRETGATGWLVKPFDPSRLLEVVGRVMR